MSNKKIDLLPCPHCGGVKTDIDELGKERFDETEPPDVYWVVCRTCFTTGGSGGSKKEAAENWNRRVSQ
jgi:Lar family restriction alleviation protein